MPARVWAPSFVAAAAVVFAIPFLSQGKVHAADSVQGVPIAGVCDRACLSGFVDQYLAALLAKDPARLPWAPHVKFTENNVELPVGWGLWGTLSALGAEGVRAADPETGQAA